MTVGEVQGNGRQGGKTGTFRGSEHAIELVPEVRVEVIVADGEIIEAIAGAGRSGGTGDDGI